MRFARRRGEVPVKRYEVSSVSPGGKTPTSGIPQNPLHSNMNIRGPLAMNSFPPPNLTLAYWSTYLVAQFMNVEEGHKLGVRHVGGLGHVAPI